MRSTVQRNLQLTATRHQWRLRARPLASHALEINLREQIENELEAISPGEKREYQKMMQSRFIKLANKPEFQRKRRKKIR